MTGYNFQGIVVDIKADNSHASGRVMDTISNIDLIGDLLQISAGAVVISGTSGRVDVGAADASNVIGIATQTRAAGDVRPLTYTRKGMVHAITNGSAVVVGSRLKVGAQGMVALAAANGSEANLEIGKCLEISSQAVGTVIVIELTL